MCDFTLTFYVKERTPRCERVIANLRRMFNGGLVQRCKLEIIDATGLPRLVWIEGTSTAQPPPEEPPHTLGRIREHLSDREADTPGPDRQLASQRPPGGDSGP